MSAMMRAEEMDKFRAAIDQLEGVDPLKKFVYAYANINLDGSRLTDRNDVLEAVLFAVWLEACGHLNLQPGDPTCAARPKL